jgi:hypothetical protein
MRLRRTDQACKNTARSCSDKASVSIVRRAATVMAATQSSVSLRRARAPRPARLALGRLVEAETEAVCPYPIFPDRRGEPAIPSIHEKLLRATSTWGLFAPMPRESGGSSPRMRDAFSPPTIRTAIAMAERRC